MDGSKGSYGNHYDRAAFYYYMLKGDEVTALEHARKACVDSNDFLLYLEYITVASTPAVELNWYYNNRSYILLTRIFNELEDYDSMMKVIVQSKNYGLYEQNYGLLGKKYPREFISFLIGYLPRPIKKLCSMSSYDRLVGLVNMIIDLKPNKEERVKLLELIENSDNDYLKELLSKEISYLSGKNYLGYRYK